MKDTFKPSRNDWSMLNVVLAAMGVVAGWPLLWTLSDLLRGRALQFVGYAVVTPPKVDDSALTRAEAAYTGQARFSVANASPIQWLLIIALELVTLAVAVVCLTQVGKLVRRARRDDPFDAVALRAVRILGYTLFCFGLFMPLLRSLVLATLMTQLRGEFNFVGYFDPASGWPIAVGLIIGLVGEVILRRGNQLRDDAEGLV